LADEIDAAVLVGDGHDDAVGYEEDGPDGEGQQKAVPGEVDGIATCCQTGCLAATGSDRIKLTIRRETCQWPPWRQT
jgi:hypothetical protein